MQLRFKSELRLVRYLFVHLSFLLSELGMDVLVVRRESPIGAGRIDLLGIDARGTLHVFEVKLHTTKPVVAGQLLAYRYATRTMSPDELVASVAHGPGGVDLAAEFERHFGHPMPELMVQEPVLVLIAGGFDLTTARFVMELAHSPIVIIPLGYRINEDRVDIFRAQRPDGAVEVFSNQRTAQYLELWRVDVRWDVQEFCDTQLPKVVPRMMTFAGLFAMYMDWATAQEKRRRDMPFLQRRNFAKELAAYMSNSNLWVPGYVLPGTEIDPNEALDVLPSIRPRKTAGHRIVAYQRVP